jgi:hypothetical protein
LPVASTLPYMLAGCMKQRAKTAHLLTSALAPNPHSTFRYAMTYNGPNPQPLRTQETPAFFADRRLSVLVFYEGPKPWTGDNLRFTMPGGNNGYYTPTERCALCGAHACIARERPRVLGASMPSTREGRNFAVPLPANCGRLFWAGPADLPQVGSIRGAEHWLRHRRLRSDFDRSHCVSEGARAWCCLASNALMQLKIRLAGRLGGTIV